MSNRGVTRERALAVVGLGNVSNTALAKILAAIKRDLAVVDLLGSKASIHRASLRIIDDVGQEVELQTKNGIPFTWAYASPQLLMAHLFKVCPSYCDTVVKFVRLKGNGPDRPWHVALYTDEITPGDASRPDNRRNVYLFYYSFKEFGPAVEAHDGSRMPKKKTEHNLE